MSGIIELDKSLFKWVNQHAIHPWMDIIFPILTDFHKTWMFQFILLPLLIFFSYRVYQKRGLLLFFIGLLANGFTDYVGHHVLKAYFQRPRPPIDIIDTIIRAPHFGGYSFPSNHAANMGCFAVYFSFMFPKARWFFYTLALLIAYSRVYVGVHYPTDVIAGLIIGGLFGLIFVWFTKKFIMNARKNNG